MRGTLCLNTAPASLQSDNPVHALMRHCLCQTVTLQFLQAAEAWHETEFEAAILQRKPNLSATQAHNRLGVLQRGWSNPGD